MHFQDAILWFINLIWQKGPSYVTKMFDSDCHHTSVQSYLVHEGLGEGGLVNLVVAMLAVAHNVHDHITLPLLPPLRSQLTCAHLSRQEIRQCQALRRRRQQPSQKELA